MLRADTRRVGPALPLICPVCSAPLAAAGGTFVCPRRHTFNRSRHGYIDLLPPGHGRALEGDTREMVQARRRFLDRGFYAPLRERIAHAVRAHAGAVDADARTPCVLEVGCGDGYYLDGTGAGLPGPAVLLGLDVSRAALRLAARRHRTATFFVNDVAHRICVANRSVDVLLNVFAPRNTSEFARVAGRGGLLVVAIPGERHLAEVRESLPLLAIPADKRERVIGALTADFTLQHEEIVECDVALDAAALDDLLRMTPSAHHLDERVAGEAAARAPLRTTTHFRILLLRR